MPERLPYYVAFLHPPAGKGSWRIAFPDVPECAASGGDFLATLSDGSDALSLHLSNLIAEGRELPVPGTWEALQPSAIRAGAVPQLVMPRLVAPPRLRVNISIGADILRLADEWAEARGMTRSGLIEVALERHVSAGRA